MAAPPETPEQLNARVRSNFDAQVFMRTLGADLSVVEPGRVVIMLPFSESITQQDGFVHAGALATIADSACGYSALTMMLPSDRVLSIEFKVNMLKPAVGDLFRAEARVLRVGKTISVCEASVYAIREIGRAHV